MLTKKSPVTAGALSAALAIGVAGCASDGTLDRRQIGTAVGAVAGGLLGSTIGAGSGRTAAVIAGSVIGGLIGSEFGRLLDENDRLRAEQTAQDALERYPSGSTARWENPDNDVYGEVTPEPPYQSERGEICREYTQTITIEGRGETARGVACRNPDGTWRIVNA